MKNTYFTFFAILFSVSFGFSQVEWIGNSADWFDANNWDQPSAPDLSDNVLIPEALVIYPEITGAAEANDILIENGASITLMAGSSLTIAGTLVEDGGFLENAPNTCLITDNVGGNDVFKAVAIPNEPTGDANQDFCDNATVAELSATGDNIQWYENTTSTTPLNGADALVDGESYFATQTDEGCESEDRLEVTVSIQASPNVDAGTNQTVCEGDEVTLTAFNPDGATISWDNGVTDGDPFIPSVGSTTYTVTAELNGCESTDQVVVDVDEAPTVEAGTDQIVCDGEDVTLTAFNPDGATISWDNGVTDGASFIPSVGSTTYTVTAELNGCESTDQVVVDVNIIPSVDAGTSQTVCEGDEVTLTAFNPDVATISWDNSVTDGDPFTPSAGSTTYTVIAELDGCESIDQVVVDVNSEFNTTDEITSCESYTWVDGVEYTESNNTATFTFTSVGGCDSIVTLDLTIASGINLNVNQVVNSQGTLVLIAEQANATYRWLDCNNGFEPISGANNRTFAPTENGEYAVAITKGNCTDTTACVNISTLSNKEFSQKDIKVYPNPSKGLFKVETPSTEGTIEVIDALGRNIKSVTISSDITEVELTGQNKGVYIFKINQSNNSITKRVIVE